MLLARRAQAVEVLLVREVMVQAELRGLDPLELLLHRPFGRQLHVEVERGVDAIPSLVDRVAEPAVQLLADPLHEVRCDVAVVLPGTHDQRVGLPPFGILRREIPLIPHQREHRVPAPHGAIGVSPRIVRIGSRQDAGEQRGLGRIHVPRRLAEVPLRGRLDPVGAAAQKDLVQVQLEDAVLRVGLLELQRDAHLPDLPARRFRARQLLVPHVAGELHGDRRETLRVPHGEQVRADRAEDPTEID
ncbi:MAG: hypothetical protein AMS20_16965, partial [Gemmatimonas sp. SG8_28]